MSKKYFKILIALIAVSVFALPAFASQTVPGDVIVIFKNGSGNAVRSSTLKANGEHFSQVNAAAKHLNAKVAKFYDAISESGNNIIVLLHSDSKDENELLKEVLARPDVKGASLNYIAQPLAVPNDPFYVYGNLWGMQAIKADKVWANDYTGSESVYVAVIDSGLYVNSGALHEDLAANIDTEHSCGFKYNFDDATADFISKVSGEEGYRDKSNNAFFDYGHGTHVSGTIGAVGGNGIGVVGVNWKTKIIMFNSYNARRHGHLSGLIIAALDDIVRLKKSGLNIAALNMSLGGFTSDKPEDVSNSTDPYWAALKAVSDQGIVLCVSAGNEDARVGYPTTYEDPSGEFIVNQYVYPASYLNIDNMIVVAAATQDDSGKIIRSAGALGLFEANTNYGDKVDITAPGASIISTAPYDCYYGIVEPVEPYSGDVGVLPEPEPDDYSVYNNYEIVDTSTAKYASMFGTSMAAPHVTGAAALLKSVYPKATAAQIKKAILDGANRIYCTNDANDESYYTRSPQLQPRDVTSRCGLLDIKKALAKLGEAVNGNSGSDGGDNGSDNNSNGGADDPRLNSDGTYTLPEDIKPLWALHMTLTYLYDTLFARSFNAETPTDTRYQYGENNPVQFTLSTPRLSAGTYIYVRLTPSSGNGVSAAAASAVDAVMAVDNTSNRASNVLIIDPSKLYKPDSTSEHVSIEEGLYDLKATTAGSSAVDQSVLALYADRLDFAAYNINEKPGDGNNDSENTGDGGNDGENNPGDGSNDGNNDGENNPGDGSNDGNNDGENNPGDGNNDGNNDSENNPGDGNNSYYSDKSGKSGGSSGGGGCDTVLMGTGALIILAGIFAVRRRKA